MQRPIAQLCDAEHDAAEAERNSEKEYLPCYVLERAKNLTFGDGLEFSNGFLFRGGPHFR